MQKSKYVQCSKLKQFVFTLILQLKVARMSFCPKSHGHNNMHLLCWQLELAFKETQRVHATTLSLAWEAIYVCAFGAIGRLFSSKAMTVAKLPITTISSVLLCGFCACMLTVISCCPGLSQHTCIYWKSNGWSYPPSPLRTETYIGECYVVSLTYNRAKVDVTFYYSMEDQKHPQIEDIFCVSQLYRIHTYPKPPSCSITYYLPL